MDAAVHRALPRRVARGASWARGVLLAAGFVATVTFFIGLRAVGKGGQKRWLVDYWQPYAITPLNLVE